MPKAMKPGKRRRVPLVLVTLCVLAASPGAAQTLVAFVTSSSGSPDLASWPESGGLAGLAGGDEICRQRAIAGGIPESGRFVAFLSNQVDDAYCRVRGLSGKKFSNCGVSGSLPPNGPWQRSDGAPFFAAIDDALAPTYRVYRPVELDEFGMPVPSFNNTYFTGTNSSGVAVGNDCDNWSSDSVSGSVLSRGVPTSTGSQWIAGAFIDNCDTTGRLLCMQSGAGDPLEPWQQPARLVFVSADSVLPRFELDPQSQGAVGIAGADNICKAKAAAAGLAHASRFKAWLSDSLVDAKDRFMDGPWKRLDGVRISDNLADFNDGELQSTLSQDELGTYTGGASVWTGTLSDGTASLDHCVDWTADDSGAIGVTSAATRTVDWAAIIPVACSNGATRLFCFEDGVVDEIFRDGFETGTSAAWAASTP